MKDKIMNLIQTLLSNRHTSAAAVLYALSKFGCPVLSAWLPTHKAAIDTTAQYLEGAAIFYGFAASGDASRSATKEQVAKAVESGDTSVLKK